MVDPDKVVYFIGMVAAIGIASYFAHNTLFSACIGIKWYWLCAVSWYIVMIVGVVIILLFMTKPKHLSK